MHHTMSATRRVALTSAIAGVLAAGLSGCGTSTADSGGGTGRPAPTALTLEDGWVKSVDQMPMDSPSPSATMSMDMSSPSPSASAMGDMGGMDMSMPMSAMFGTLHNTTGSDITVEGGSSPAAGRVELHTTVKNASGAMQMQPAQGGFVVPAGGTHVLQPGGDHVMLMELTGALPNGSQTTVTLRTSSGEVTLTVPVRAFSGAQESYAPSPSTS
jgi:copper(I)-binding protein